MDDPQTCSICNRPLRHIKHLTAHGGVTSWDARVRTCPHNLGSHCFDGVRHDEWHLRADGWVKRET